MHTSWIARKSPRLYSPRRGIAFTKCFLMPTLYLRKRCDDPACYAVAYRTHSGHSARVRNSIEAADPAGCCGAQFAFAVLDFPEFGDTQDNRTASDCSGVAALHQPEQCQ